MQELPSTSMPLRAGWRRIGTFATCSCFARRLASKGAKQDFPKRTLDAMKNVNRETRPRTFRCRYMAMGNWLRFATPTASRCGGPARGGEVARRRSDLPCQLQGVAQVSISWLLQIRQYL